MITHINAIGTAVPKWRLSQPELYEWMASVNGMSAPERKFLKTVFDMSTVQTRYSVIPDYGRKPQDHSFFPRTPDLEPMPGTAGRMLAYRQHALPLSIQAIERCMDGMNESDRKAITHLIIVSCTGLYAPGLDIELVEALGLPGNVQRSSIQFMGCYAAFNGLKAADYICRSDPNARVLLVCVELCTLHFRKSRERDNLVANALFSDGAAAVLLSSKPAPGRLNLSLDKFHCDLASHGKKDMAWHVGDSGFEMTLSSYVPIAIKGGIRELTDRLLRSLNMDKTQVDRYAIHPGGPAILDAIETELGISKEDNRHAYSVLRDYGNMSSGTVLFVLSRLMDELKEQNTSDPKRILSFAFGPGLTMESMLLRSVVG